MEAPTEAKAALPAQPDSGSDAQTRNDEDGPQVVMAAPVEEGEVVEAVVTEKHVDTRDKGQMEDLETDLGLDQTLPRGKKLSAKQRKQKQLRKMQRKIVRGAVLPCSDHHNGLTTAV